jgi:hypothetical protein
MKKWNLSVLDLVRRGVDALIPQNLTQYQSKVISKFPQ